MKIDGDKIQEILKDWRYRGYRIISLSVSEDGYELIATGEKSRGVFVKASTLEEAIRYLEYEIEEIVVEGYLGLRARNKNKRHKTVA